VNRILLVTADAERIKDEFDLGGQPRVDFLEIAKALDAEIISYSDVDSATALTVKLVRRLLGRNVALAFMGYRQKADSCFTTAENVGMALAFLLRFRQRRPSHVMISHKLSAGKKKWIFRALGLKKSVDGLIAYTSEQTLFAEKWLGFDESRLHRIQFHCDHTFFKPPEREALPREGIVSVGRELRDYPTLIEAVRGQDVRASIVGSSPWSRRRDLLTSQEIPSNVQLLSGLSYEELRDLYLSSALAVVPLLDVDSPAGVTSIFEALATETPVLVSRTKGIEDSIRDCPGVMTVKQGDPASLRDAIADALSDRDRLAAMGRDGREAIENDRSLDHFVDTIRHIVVEV